MGLWKSLVGITGRRGVRNVWNGVMVVFLILFVVLPTVYVLSYVFTDWGDIRENVVEGDSVTLVWNRDESDAFARYELIAVDPAGAPDDAYGQVIDKQEETTTVVTSLDDAGSYTFILRTVYGEQFYFDSEPAGALDGELPEAGATSAVWMDGNVMMVSFSGNVTDFTLVYSADGWATFDTAGGVNGTAGVNLSGQISSAEFFARYVGEFNLTSVSPLYRYDVASNDTAVLAEPEARELEEFQAMSTLGILLAAILNSFEIAVIVTVIDVIFGFPMAWLLVRKKFPGKKVLDTLIDLPLAIPTAALGFSTALFWVAYTGEPPPLGNAGVVSSPFVLLILLHIVFTFPYMVRSLSAILEEIDVNYEIAAETLGASRFSMIRTVTLPLFKSGLATGMMLCLARSLSETGGTMIALTTMAKIEVFQTAPVVIGTWKHARAYNPALVPSLAFASILLILLSLVMLIIIKFMVSGTRFPIPRAFPSVENWLSAKPMKIGNYSLTILFLLFLVLIPSSFILTYVVDVTTGGLDWQGLANALFYSFSIAGVVTIIDLFTGIPMAVLISRGRVKWLSGVLDVLVNVPLVVPTAALGFSLGLFFTDVVSIQSAFLLIVLAHVAFTYPLVVRNVVGALDGINVAYEDAGRTLGGKPLEVFRSIVFPLVRPSVLAGSIMAFTRSLGETGATLAVVAAANTVPVFIVTLVKSGDLMTAAMSCIILMVVSFGLILAARYALSKEVRREW